MDGDEFLRFVQEDLQKQYRKALGRIRSYPTGTGSTIFYVSDDPIPTHPDEDGVYQITDVQEPAHAQDSAQADRPDRGHPRLTRGH